MAATVSCSANDAFTQKLYLNSKRVSDTLNKINIRRNVGIVSRLSPEAEVALRMTKADVKENISFETPTVNTECRNEQDKNSVNETNRGEKNLITLGTARGQKMTFKTASTRPTSLHAQESSRHRKSALASAAATTRTGTSRSRSTLSHTDRNHSISDNADSCYNYKSGKPLNGNTINKTLPKNDIDVKLDNNTIPKEQLQHNDTMKDTSNKINNTNKTPDNEQADNPKSFVLALDQVLEKRLLSRLKGDITDMTRVSVPGKVRALDGGRLTNAQEVVVNVSHDDKRELIFHDDDEESLRNAQAISEIRINLWLKYNEDFHPENIPEDFPTKNVNLLHKLPSFSELVKESKTPSASVANKASLGTLQILSKNKHRVKWQATKKDVVNINPIMKRDTSSTNSKRYNSSLKVRPGNSPCVS